MSNTIVFAVGTLVFIGVATATFIWGYLQFDALRVGDDRETERADSGRLLADAALGAGEVVARVPGPSGGATARRNRTHGRAR